MKKLILAISVLALAGCSTIADIKKYWPRAHDPVLVDQWVNTHIAIEAVDCALSPTGWEKVPLQSQRLYMLADFRQDPQSENLKGLFEHSKKMSQGGSKMFCEIGKKTAFQRLDAAKTAWEGR